MLYFSNRSHCCSWRTGVTGTAGPGLDFHMPLAFQALKVKPLARPCPWFWYLHTQMSSDLGLTPRFKFAQLQISSAPTGLHIVSFTCTTQEALADQAQPLRFFSLGSYTRELYKAAVFANFTVVLPTPSPNQPCNLGHCRTSLGFSLFIYLLIFDNQ